MIYNIVHRSTYKYKFPVSVGNHVACLKPRSSPHQQLTQTELHYPSTSGDDHGASGLLRKPAVLFLGSGAA